MSPAVVLEQSALLAVQRPTGAVGSPGVLGFVVTFAVALVVVGLVLAMTSSLRRVKHRAQLQDEEAARSPERRAVSRDVDDATAESTAPEGAATAGGPSEAVRDGLGEDPDGGDRASSGP